jgi:hypothetical protein
MKRNHVRARSLLRRLSALGFPQLYRDFTALHPREQNDYWEIFLSLQDGEGSDKELEYFRELIKKCPLVEGEAFRFRLQRWPLDENLEVKQCFAAMFQNFAQLNHGVAVPSRHNRLSLWRRQVAYQIFQKYGWKVGNGDCAGIQLLQHWEAADREFIMELYRRAQPASDQLPPGWESKYDSRLPFR